MCYLRNWYPVTEITVSSIEVGQGPVGGNVRYANFREYLRSSMVKMHEHWHQRLTLKDRGFAESYVQGSIELLILFKDERSRKGRSAFAARLHYDPVITGTRPFR